MSATDETRKDMEIRRPFDPSRAAFKEYDTDLMNLVSAALLPVGAKEADKYFLLELSARYGLDPFAREIWAVRMPGRDGTEGRMAIMVGRDGLLAIASRNAHYRGFRNLTVHENDDFRYLVKPEKMPDGTYTHVEHAWGKPRERGEIVGSWSEVYRDDRPPVFFYADLDEYMPESEAKLRYSPWKQQRSVMIAKCSLATALRLAFRISGLYIEEEMARALEQPVPTSNGADYGEDEDLATELRLLFQAAEEAEPGSWLPGKVRVTLRGCSDRDDRVALRAFLRDFIVDRGGKLPEMVTIEEPPEPEPLEPDPAEVEEATFAPMDPQGETQEDSQERRVSASLKVPS